ncbi:MAG: Fic family protein [Patescibacteria group bacterium]
MEFNPRYTITPKILENIKKITVIKTELNNKRFPEIIKMKLEKSARDLSVHSSTSIEGNPLPLTEVKKVLKNKPEYIRDSEREVLNYNNALEFLDKQLKKSKRSLDAKLILNIHIMVMKDLLSSHKLNNFRTEPVFVNDPKLRKTVYWPPDTKDVSKLIGELILYVNDNYDRVDPILLAGIFHKQFVVIHPFVDGNGRTTRLLTKYLLTNMGLDTFNLFSFENYYNENVTRYFQNVGVIGNYYDIKDQLDFTTWLEYFTDGIVDELLRVSAELKKVEINPETSLKPHHTQILKYIEEHGFIADSDYAKLTNRAKATRALDFDKLIKLGMLKREGKGRATHYTLK